jgi:hypothetical protein
MRRSGSQLSEEVLESCRGDDLEDPAWLVAGIRERMPLVAGLERKIARPGAVHGLTPIGRPEEMGCRPHFS